MDTEKSEHESPAVVVKKLGKQTWIRTGSGQLFIVAGDHAGPSLPPPPEVAATPASTKPVASPAQPNATRALDELRVRN